MNNEENTPAVDKNDPQTDNQNNAHHVISVSEVGAAKKYHDENGNLSRMDGPAKTCYFPDGSVEYESYYVDGHRHRIGGPADIFYYKDGTISGEVYYVNDQIHRVGGPAEVSYYSNGSVKKETYCINGKRHRTDGPAAIEYYEDGTVEKESYFIDGDLRRDDGPAEIWYYPDGSVERETYCADGGLHRTDGPAMILYSENGKVKKARWFNDGEEFTPSPEQVEAWKEKSKITMEEECVHGSLRKFSSWLAAKLHGRTGLNSTQVAATEPALSTENRLELLRKEQSLQKTSTTDAPTGSITDHAESQ